MIKTALAWVGATVIVWIAFSWARKEWENGKRVIDQG